jgi:DUF4097 and DUF4098 domain-containing protein YvlB
MKCVLASSKILTLTVAVCLSLSILAQETSAQKKFSRTYQSGKNVRLQLLNRSGTVTVEGWEKNEIRITARMEAPAANIVPQNLSGTIVVNVVKDNQGRSEVGNVNFDIKVPVNSAVDIQTVIGNLTVSNVRGALVRAHVTSEGDITLSDITATSVTAENMIGDIFFDGELKSGGNYRFSSTRGNINIRIPFSSSFRLVATAPSSRSISLGAFSNAGLNFVSDGRRVVGRVGDGSATMNITNQRGSISFVRR